jgi:flagellar biogenesis protein FliO
MAEALRAIEAAQADTDEPSPAAAHAPFKAARGAVWAETRRPFASRWLAALDKLPPIRLPIGPAIPWRIGLPALLGLMVLTVVVGRPGETARADAPGVRLPAQETYAAQQAPLFANQAPPPGAPAEAAAETTPGTPVTNSQAPASKPLGVAEPPAGSFDLFDVGLKLLAVLALAYGSLMLLKRTGLGGASAAGGKSGGQLQGMRVLSTLALAPNRSVHVLRVPGGRTLLVGATPNSVNLIADLGTLADDEAPDAASLLDLFKGKLS